MAVLMLSSMAMAQRSLGTPVTRELAVKAGSMKPAKLHESKAAVAAPASKDVISTFPYVESFENGSSNWTLVDNDNDGSTWSLSTTLGGTWGIHTGNDCMISGSYDPNLQVALTPDNWMISSQIQLPSDATDFVLSWWDAAQDPDYPSEHYSVYIATSNTVAALSATTPVFSTTLTSDAWTKRTVDLSSYAGQSIYVAFRHHNCTDMFFMKIDDVRIGGPEAPSVSITAPLMAESNTPVQLSATVSGATSVVWTLNGATPATATTNDVTATWATAGIYTVVATATNSVGSASDSATIEIYTCETISTFPFMPNLANGLGCWTNRSDSTAGMGWTSAGDVEGLDEGSVASFSAQSIFGIFMMDVPVDNWLTSPQIDIPATGEYELSWEVKPFEPAYAGDHYSVYAIVNNQPVVLFSETLNSNMTTWEHRVASLSNYAGQTIRVAFRHHDSQGGYVILLDQIGIDTLSAPLVRLQGPAYAKVDQAATFVANSGNASSYTWVVDDASLSETTNVLTHTFTTPGNHTVVVTAHNSVGSTTDSLTIEAIECQTINTIPFTEGFENQILCWETVSMDASNDQQFGIVAQDQDIQAHSGTQMFRFSSYAQASDFNQYLITPEIELNDTVAVKFWYMGYNTADAFRVLYSTTGNQPSDFTHVLADYPSVPTTWTMFGALLPSEAKYVAINYYGDYQYFLYVDDFEISELTAPTATISAPASAWVNNEVTISANAVMADTYSWSVDGTAQSSTTNTLSYVFTTTGNHTVELTVGNRQGTATVSATIEVKAWGDTMYYDNGIFENAIGTGGEIFWAIKFNPADLQGRNYLTRVLFYSPENGNGAYDVRIYQGGETAPQTLVGQQNYNCGQSESWQNVRLDRSVQIDATKSLWVVLHTTSVEYPAAGAAFDGNYNSSWASIDGQTWGSVQELSDGALSNSWMIRAITASEALCIDEVQGFEMALYPNPTSGRINIVAEGIEMVEVLDMNGRIVMTQKSSSLNLGGLANGIYMVRVISENGVAMQKVVKK